MEVLHHCKLIDTLGRKPTPAAPARTDTRRAHGTAHKDTDGERSTERNGEIYKNVTRKEHS